MKPGKFVICLFVKRSRLFPQDSLHLSPELEALNYIPRLKEDSEDCEKLPLGVELALAVAVLVLILTLISLMEPNQVKILFETKLNKKRLSQGQDSKRLIKKSASANQVSIPHVPKVIKPANGHFRFRTGFLTNSKKILSQNSISHEVPDFVDVSKPAEPVENGNITVVYKLFNSESSPSAIFKPFEDVSDQNKENLTPEYDFESQKALILCPRAHCENEVLAFKFDKMINAGVPETQMISMPKDMFGGSKFVNGSLQKFVIGESCEDFGPGLFSAEDVHKIGVLDIMILNCDRHSGNMLFDPEIKKLTPIDHALSFPSLEFLESGNDSPAVLARGDVKSELFLKHVNYDWSFFPQASQPFSPETLSRIEQINVSSLLAELTSNGFSNSKKLAVFSSATLLKVAALRYKKNLREIAEVIQRQGSREEKSVLELMVLEVSKKLNANKLVAGDAAETAAFCANFESAVDGFFKL